MVAAALTDSAAATRDARYVKTSAASASSTTHDPNCPPHARSSQCTCACGEPLESTQRCRTKASFWFTHVPGFPLVPHMQTWVNPAQPRGMHMYTLHGIHGHTHACACACRQRTLISIYMPAAHIAIHLHGYPSTSFTCPRKGPSTTSPPCRPSPPAVSPLPGLATMRGG